MTLGDSIFFASLFALIAFLVWAKKERHRHKWKETARDEVIRAKDEKFIGLRSYCICEECGEQRHFNLY